jgi:chromosome partitioning protein
MALGTIGVVAATVMVNRIDHADAVAAGYGITEYRAESAAADELRSLWNEIEQKLGMGRVRHDKAA